MSVLLRRVGRLALAFVLVLPIAALPAPASATHQGGNGPIIFARAGDLWSVTPGFEAVRITDTPEIIEDHPAVSPDGTMIAYERQGDGTMDSNPAIWVAGIDGSGPRDITTTFRHIFLAAWGPTWAPNGSLVAFQIDDADYPYRDRIVVARADGTGGMPVTPIDADITQPAWSPVPGSTEIAVTIGTDIWIIDADTGDQRLVIDGFDLGWEAPSDPDWSPDGSALVMQCGTSNTCAIDVDGSDLRWLEEEPGVFTQAPSWSPDGTAVAVQLQDDTGHQQIATMPVEGVHAGLTVLTSGAYSTTFPAWAPSGTAPPPPPPPPGGDDPPSPVPGMAQAFDGDPATTERIDLSPATTAAIGISQTVFHPGTARHVVLSRHDAFADSLAGTSLVGEGPLLLSRSDHLTASTHEEIWRVLPAGGVVYLLGGTAALGPAVETTLRHDGYDVMRLAGASRTETALAVADEALDLYGAQTVMVARAFGAPGNETSAWADSVSAGGWSAAMGAPILLTATESLHPAVAAWLDARAPTYTVLLGGAAVLSPAVEQAIPGALRIAGEERTATAVAIAMDLWGAQPDEPGAYVVINGVHPDGWAYGLAASLLAMQFRAPVLMVGDQVPQSVLTLVGSCGLAQVDMVLVGDRTMITGDVESRLDVLDGGMC